MTSEPLFPDVIDFQEGPGIMARDFRDSGVPLIRLAGLSGGSLLTGCNHLDPEMVERKWSHFRLKEGDTLISTSASLGRVARVTEEAEGAIAYTGIIRMRPRDGRLVSDFIQYVVEDTHFQRQVDAMGAGSVMRHFGPSHLRKMTVLAPPPKEQRAIASLLGALDDKINSNLRLNIRLDELARGLLRRLLYRPSVPWERSWPDTTLGEVLSVLETGNRPRGGVKGIASGVPSIGAESIVGAGIFDFAKLKFIPDDYYAKLTRGRVEDRDVLLYKDGGRPGLFEPHVSMVGEGFPFREAAINEHVYRLRIKPPYSQDFLYLWLSSNRAVEEMRRRGTGVAVPGLNSKAVKALPIIAPDPEILTSVQDAIAPLITLILESAGESRTHAEIRATLLPKLISGEIRVSDTTDSEEVSGPAAEQLAGAKA
jgi:type I restriction enzyme, S subunit